MLLSAKTTEFIEKIVQLLDNRFGPQSFRFGIDPLFSLIPGIGAFIPAFFTLFLVCLGVCARVPGTILLKMMGYLMVDFIISLAPVLSLPLDAIFHANANCWHLLKPFVTQKKDMDAKFPGKQAVIDGEVVT